MVEDFSKADKTGEEMDGDDGCKMEPEAHAEAEEAAGAGDVGDPAHLLRLAEPLAVGLLDEDVDDGQVALRVVVDFTLNCQSQGLVL